MAATHGDKLKPYPQACLSRQTSKNTERYLGNFRDVSVSFCLFQRPLQPRSCFDRGSSRKLWISTRPIYTHTHSSFLMNIYAIYYLAGTKPGVFGQTGSFPRASGKEEINPVPSVAKVRDPDLVPQTKVVLHWHKEGLA